MDKEAWIVSEEDADYLGLPHHGAVLVLLKSYDDIDAFASFDVDDVVEERAQDADREER